MCLKYCVFTKLSVDSPSCTESPATMSEHRSQRTLDAFVTTQLIDNRMDDIAKKINRLYIKLQQTHADEEAQKKYARLLHHHLTLACRLLARQRDDVSRCIAVIETDMKTGVLEGAKGQQGKESLPPTPQSMRHSYARSSTVNGVKRDDEILLAGRHVAAKVARSHELWILACVVRYDQFTRAYEVEDMDTGDEDEGEPADSTNTVNGSRPIVPTRRRHIVPRDQVKALPAETLAEDAWIHYTLNQNVMAIYPNTTSFYRGVVRVPNPKGAPYVLVRFDDDADEFGSAAPDRKIPFRFVLSAETS